MPLPNPDWKIPIEYQEQFIEIMRAFLEGMPEIIVDHPKGSKLDAIIMTYFNDTEYIIDSLNNFMEAEVEEKG